MTEKQITGNIGRGEGRTSKLSLEERLGLPFLDDSLNASQTIAYLHGQRERFSGGIAWKGGIGGEYSFVGVLGILRSIEKGKVTVSELTPNIKLAVVEALFMAGAVPPIGKEELEELRKKAEEDLARKVNSVLVPAMHGLSRRSLTPKRTVLLATAMATVAGAGMILYHPDLVATKLQNESQSALSSEELLAVKTAKPQASDLSSESPPVLEDLGSILKAFEPKPTPIPLVESIPSAEGSPYNLWGIDFADPSQAITVEWNYPEILVLNNGKPLGFSDFADAKDSQAKFSACVHHLDWECTMTLNRKVFVSAHTGWNGEVMLPMEEFRAFLEGGSKEHPNERLPEEERLRREQLLEKYRPTITQGTLRVSAQAAIVRIEEADRDGIYEDWNTLEDVALKYDPALGSSLNVTEPYVDFITCGWRIPGDRLSPKHHSAFSSSIYNLFLGEAAPVTFIPTPKT